MVQTLAKTFFRQGYVAVRMNFRGVGASDGVFDEGQGETQDWLVVAQALRERFGDLPLALAGFSFGAFVQARVAEHLRPQRLVLVAPGGGPLPARRGARAHARRARRAGRRRCRSRDVLDWARPQSLPVVVLPGTGHFFHGKLVELARILQRSCPC